MVNDSPITALSTLGDQGSAINQEAGLVYTLDGHEVVAEGTAYLPVVHWRYG